MYFRLGGFRYLIISGGGESKGFVTYCTCSGFNPNEWNAGIVGMHTGKVDIKEDNKRTFLTLLPVSLKDDTDGGKRKWFIKAFLNTHHKHAEWEVIVMFTRTSLFQKELAIKTFAKFHNSKKNNYANIRSFKTRFR